MPELKNLFGRKSPRAFSTMANVLTLTRAVLCLCFFSLAAVHSSPLYNLIGLGIHFFLDFLDGLCARSLRQETIFGAEIDIIADRIDLVFFYVNFVHFHPGLYLPTAIYLLDYALIDFYLSYQFLKYDIISPNYFGQVSPVVYRLNFSPPAKFCNSTLVAFLLILLPRLPVLPTIVAIALCGIKLYSIRLLIGKTTK